MHMENLTQSIKSPRLVFSQTKEQSVEADLVLPDYYPEISKILDCSMTLSEEAVTVTADKISIAGEANIRLLYSCAQNGLHVYETVSKYTKLVPGGSFENNDLCLVRQDLIRLNFRAVSPRKTEVRAVAAIKTDVLRMQETVCLSAETDGNLQLRTACDNGFCISAYARVSIELEEKIGLPAAREKISGILRQNARVSFSDVRAVSNKMMLTGTAEIAFVYLKADHTVSTEHRISLPFTQIADVYGAREEDLCYLAVQGADAVIDLKNMSEEDTQAAVRIRANLLAVTGKQQTYQYVEDAYSIRGRMKTEAKKCLLSDGIVQTSQPLRVESELQTYDVEVREICDRSVCDVSLTASVSDGNMEVNGSLNLKVLGRTSEGSFCCFSRSCSFSHSFPLAGNNVFYVLQAVPGAVSADTAGSGVIRFGCDMTLNLFLLQGRDVTLISGIVTETGDKEPRNEQIVLYYGAKGEVLWDIAKENRTSVALLKTLNALEDDVLPEDRLLVFRNGSC